MRFFSPTAPFPVLLVYYRWTYCNYLLTFVVYHLAPRPSFFVFLTLYTSLVPTTSPFFSPQHTSFPGEAARHHPRHQSVTTSITGGAFYITSTSPFNSETSQSVRNTSKEGSTPVSSPALARHRSNRGGLLVVIVRSSDAYFR